MRRVLISLGLVGFVALALIIATPFIQARRLVKQLRVDVEALRAREIPRVPPIDQPLHDNGFECLKQQIDAAPADLKPFAQDKELDVLPWIHGEQPIATLPPVARSRMDDLAGWSAALRSCVSSRMLRAVPGLEPWDPLVRASLVESTFTKLAVLEVQTLRADGQREEAMLRCIESFELLADLSHVEVGLATSTRSFASEMVRDCAGAWAELSRESRGHFAPRLQALKSRWSTEREMAELLRLYMNAELFAPLAGHHEFDVTFLEPNFIDEYTGLVIWSDADKTMRELEAGDRKAAARLYDQFNGWWVSRAIEGEYPFDVVWRAARTQPKLDLLPWIAAGASGDPPFGTRVDGGVEVKGHGGVMFLPVPAE